MAALMLLLPLPQRLGSDQNGKNESALPDGLMAFCSLPVALLLIHKQERLISIGALKKPAWRIPERKQIET
ncbi:MAG: hypothetical protein M3299_12510, partial [Thermoproteota archaeon]|nr:hypothetical protein [Thermoproteota archaeon]